MPEPEKDETQTVVGDLNKPAPFETLDDFHAKLKDKLIFLFIPVISTYFASGMVRGTTLDFEGTHEYQGRFYVYWCCKVIFKYYQLQMWLCYFLDWRGVDPGRYAMRYGAVALMVAVPCQPGQDLGTQINGSQMAQFHFHSDRWWAFETYYTVISQVMNEFLLVWSCQPKNKFMDRSAFGTYCCAAFARGRMIRVAFLACNLNLMDYFVSGALMNPRLVPLGSVLPPIVFAWKRAKYILLMLMCLEDSPFKDRALFSWCWIVFLTFNHILALSMIGCENWSTFATYVLVIGFSFVFEWFF